MKVRVKSRTGREYLRGPRVWAHDRWARVELDEATVELLRRDPHLDVEPLADDAPIDAPELTPLEQAQADIVALRHENAQLRAEIEALRAAAPPRKNR